MFAIRANYSDPVKDLLERGADINANSQLELQDSTASGLLASLQTQTETQHSCLQHITMTVTL
jgi:hypothetical protein